MNESIKSNFEIFIDRHQPNKESKKQYLNDWSHLYLSQESCPSSYQKVVMKYPPTTRIANAIVSILLPEASKFPGSINRNSSSIVFWTSISSQNTPEINLSEINSAITNAYKSRFSRINLNILTDFKQDIFTQYLKDNNKDLTKRTLVHFISDLSPELNSPIRKAEQFRQLREIIKSTLHCGVHIIDCDMAGIYYPQYLDIFKETEFTMQHQNLFVFFSCLENQKVPKLPGLPNDLFSSFLISPAKTALLCHSWHYFCFNHDPYSNFKDDSIFNLNINTNSSHDSSQQQSKEKDEWNDSHSQLFFRSSLSPLTIEQINSAPKDLLDNLMNSLRRIVEAMLCDSEYFTIFFKIDEAVADLFIGLAVAQHFFNSFQVKPFSYPSFPDSVANHPLWSTFDLRLDAALMTLVYGHSFNSNTSDSSSKASTNSSNMNDNFPVDYKYLSTLYNIDNIPFAQHELQTIKLLIESHSPLSTFAGHVAFLPNCLIEPGMMNDSINTLASFIEEKGFPAIQMASKFPIFPSLVKIAKSTINDIKTKEMVIDSNIDTNKLLLCMSKLYVFYPNSKDLVPFFNNQYLTSFTVYHLRSENPLPALVLFTLMLKMSDGSMITLFLKCNWISITECLIQSSSIDVRIWTLLLVSSFAKYVNLTDQVLQLLDAISIAADDTSPLVRVAFLVALQSIPLSTQSSQIETSVLEASLKLIDDMNPAVRRELAALLVSMKMRYLQKATSCDDKMTPSPSMSTSDFFSESGSDMNLEMTANGTTAGSYKTPSNLNTIRPKINIGSFSFSTKSEINKIISNQEGNIDEINGNQQNNKIILSALKLLSTDPFKGVSQTAREVQKNFTFMIFFDLYISPSNFKTKKFSTSSLKSEVKLNNADLKRVRLENIFNMKHFVLNANTNQCITSNIAFSCLDDNQLFFGTDGGHIISQSLQQQQLVVSSSLKADKSVIQGFTSQSPITHVHCVENNGFPLLLVSNNSGDFFAGDLFNYQLNSKSNKMPILTSFRVFLNSNSCIKNNDQTALSKGKNLTSDSLSSSSSFCLNCDFKEPAKRGYEFEYVSRDSRLYFYAPKTGCNVNLYDLLSEQKVGEIRSLKDNITAIHSPSYLSDCLFVCDEDFLLYDCRASLDEPVLTYVPSAPQSSDTQFNKVYSCKSFNKEPFLLPVCTYGGSVLYNDLRALNLTVGGLGGLKKQCIFDCSFSDAQTLCFDVNQDTLTAAVGTTKGASVFFYPGDKKIVFPSKQKLAQPVFRLEWMQGRFGMVIMQNYTDIQSCTFY